MSDIIIKIESISKQYRLGQVGTGTISHDLNRWWYKVRGKEDPYLKIGDTNDRTAKSKSGYVWALKDISFDVKQGEVLGIIGKNGAGKSTLLKLLSRVTAPTTGSIKAKGRIASLLEVGTGFHPELTGRENVFMNGSILGMTKAEIKQKFDEIVAFAGVEKYIDTPVKRYSSGMTVRLGFAVAAHLEPEIMVVDEVLAVGDAEFQKKAIGKMQNVSHSEGRTILFVSHNMDAIKKMCTRAVLLKDGSMQCQGNVDSILDIYINENKGNCNIIANEVVNNDMCILSASVYGEKGESSDILMIGEDWYAQIDIALRNEIKDTVFAVGISTMLDIPIITTWTPPQNLKPGKYAIRFSCNSMHFQKGNYKTVVGISKGKESLYYNDSDIQFEVALVQKEINENLIKVDGTTGILVNQLQTEIITL